ncbi:hypothetical protein LXL04_029728 [Taraxacum kok-saghyz]
MSWQEELMVVASEPFDEFLIISVEDRIGSWKEKWVRTRTLLNTLTPRSNFDDQDRHSENPETIGTIIMNRNNNDSSGSENTFGDKSDYRNVGFHANTCHSIVFKTGKSKSYCKNVYQDNAFAEMMNRGGAKNVSSSFEGPIVIR